VVSLKNGGDEDTAGFIPRNDNPAGYVLGDVLMRENSCDKCLTFFENMPCANVHPGNRTLWSLSYQIKSSHERTLISRIEYGAVHFKILRVSNKRNCLLLPAERKILAL
jgi:hypothetical protein